jgi:hypothetical protein
MLIRIKNGEVENFCNFLLTLELKGKQSRMRTRFIRLLNEHVQLIKSEHKELILVYANLEEDGTPRILTNESGQQVYDIKDMASFNREYSELMLEELIIEVTDANKDMINTTRDALLDCEQTFAGNDALIYDRYCEIIEGEE